MAAEEEATASSVPLTVFSMVTGPRDKVVTAITARPTVVLKTEKITVHGNRDNRVVTTRFCKPWR